MSSGYSIAERDTVISKEASKRVKGRAVGRLELQRHREVELDVSVPNHKAAYAHRMLLQAVRFNVTATSTSCTHLLIDWNLIGCHVGRGGAHSKEVFAGALRRRIQGSRKHRCKWLGDHLLRG